MLLGFDVGSSGIKAALLEAETGKLIGSATAPDTELPMEAVKPGWAEQHPRTWWENVRAAAAKLSRKYSKEMQSVGAVGISYQMHGLVLVDERQTVLRPSIIWCDSRAVPYGEKAFKEIGKEKCFKHLLNSPGNFTAAKLAWVRDQEPDIYKNISKIMLPGDYIGYKMTGDIRTTPSGLSEGIMWDFPEDKPAGFLLDYFGFEASFIPEIVPNFSIQGTVTSEAADLLGIPKGTPVAYRAGDQPNNALSLSVLEPGEIAATAGTSGVVYGIVDSPEYDPLSRVNSFVHVNHSAERNRFGVLLCVNGTGILNRWIKDRFLAPDGRPLTYEEMNSLGETVGPGAEGLFILPFGNGAERTLENKDLGASFHNLNFNIHSIPHIVRAGQEGIVFAFQYGLEIMKKMNLSVGTVKAGYANMFLSPLFRKVFAAVTETPVELYSTDGAQGAARGAGIGSGIYSDEQSAFVGLEKQETIGPDAQLGAEYQDLYQSWKEVLEEVLRSQQEA